VSQQIEKSQRAVKSKLFIPTSQPNDGLRWISAETLFVADGLSLITFISLRICSEIVFLITREWPESRISEHIQGIISTIIAVFEA
jgi:hypothetical protein